jgi:dihydrofolate synthase/folylpolyglutamate synthase
MNSSSTLQATSPLAMWLDYLTTIHSSAIDLGLDRVQQVASIGKLTKPAPTVITVAGTNGKGSTCSIIEAILMNAGYRVGVYSSPHLIRYNERVRIDGVELDDIDHTQAFAAIEMLRGDVSLSFFEFATLSALWLFQEKAVDVVVLEVGLGGRLDATNVVDHDVSVITSLAIDHVDWLGDDINVIGYEKAGIYRPFKPAICGQPNAPATVAAHADDIHAEFYQVGLHFDYEMQGETRWKWSSGAFALDDLPLPSLPLANAATALMAIGQSGLEVSDLNIVYGLENVTLAGRMQHEFIEGRDVIFDVAHNPHSAQYLVEQLARFDDRPIYAVVGMLHDKDIFHTLETMSPTVDHWYLASLSGPRAATADELQRALTKLGHKVGKVFEEPSAAFDQAINDSEDNALIVVFGSFHTVGEVLAHWKSKG